MIFTILSVVAACIIKLLNPGWALFFMIFMPPFPLILLGVIIFHIYAHNKTIQHSGPHYSRLLLASNILIILSALTCPDFSDVGGYVFFTLIKNPPEELFLVSAGIMTLAIVLDLYVASIGKYLYDNKVDIWGNKFE